MGTGVNAFSKNTHAHQRLTVASTAQKRRIDGGNFHCGATCTYSSDLHGGVGVSGGDQSDYATVGSE